MKERDRTRESLEFEQKVLKLFNEHKRGKITSGIISHRNQYSRKDLAAGAEAEDRRDEVAESMKNPGAA